MSREEEYQLVETCRRLSGLGMMPASDGNCSIRLNESDMLITPSGVRKEQLKPQDLVQVNLAADNASQSASSEWRMHAQVYLQYPAINAIVHAHPVYLTVSGIKERVPEINLLYETAATVKEISLIQSMEPGTGEFAQVVADGLQDATVGILKNHGALAVGESLEEALFRLERAEHLAQIDYLLTE